MNTTEDPSVHPVIVTYVEPSGQEVSGFKKIGEYPMAVPPRKGETVVMKTALRGDWQRFKVEEVVHHLPEPGLPETVLHVTILLMPVLTLADVDRVMTGLCGPGHLERVALQRASEVG